MAQKASPKKASKKTGTARKASSAGARTLRKSEPAKRLPPAKPKSPVQTATAAPEARAIRKAPAPASRVGGSGISNAGAGATLETSKEVKKEKMQTLSKSDLQYFRNLLLERRREIIGDMGSMESEAFKGGSNLSNMPIHMADVGTDNFEQEFTLGLIESERQTLREIQEALVRIDAGSYGICQGTGKLIPRVRLEAVPWAKYTIEYKRLLDQGKVAQENGQSAEEDSGDEEED
jgi:RNA polymerase-binding protein DksA